VEPKVELLDLIDCLDLLEIKVGTSAHFHFHTKPNFSSSGV